MRRSRRCQKKKFSEARFQQKRYRGLLRKRLFWQIYVVVLGSLFALSALLGVLVSLRERFPLEQQHGHPPFFLLLFVAALIVGLGAYPISRRLTYRLERLKQGVDALGQGKLETRVQVQGCDEIAQLASSFNASAERIQALLASHRQLLANASHELRSPLARMQMSLALLAEQKNLEQATEVKTLRHDMQELNQLVEEILLASRLDTVEIPLERSLVDLSALLAEECARLPRVDCEAPAIELMGDARLLRRLLRNLLENAVRHGGAEVEARLMLANQQVVLQVLDRGSGIPPEAQERVFEPFYRPVGFGEGKGGWGLGLSLVRQIANRHGGSVTCRSRDGGGSVFEVILPKQ